MTRRLLPRLLRSRDRAPHLRSVSRRVLALGLLALLLAWPTSAYAVYLFYMREDLAKVLREDPDSLVGKQVVFTDELTVIWPEARERPDNIRGRRYVLFDTEHFRCAIPADRLETHLRSIWEDAKRGYGDATTKIEEINEAERTGRKSRADAQKERDALYWELFRIWRNKPIVTVFGKVERTDFWGPVRGQGVVTERLTIVVDKVEKPRERWYQSLDD